MEWILILALGFWVWLQSQRLDTLARQLKQLEARVGEQPDAAPAPMPVAATASQPIAEPSAAASFEAPAPLELPVAANQEEPLLLDTPLPPASNDEFGGAPGTPPEIAAASITQLRPTSPKRGPQLEQWLAQNGLAWIGGGALALGAALLVAFAAQAGFFSPPMRLIAALVLGAAMLAASEWVLRKQDNALVAALLAGAGAATFYVTAWAAYGLYHYVDWRIAALLLGLCALLLFALSQRHGQALGVLAIAAALIAPALTSLNVWPSVALTIYLCAVGASGAALAAWRRWAWAAAAVLLGLYAWFAVCIAADEIGRALALIVVASLAGAAAGLRKPEDTDEAKATLNWGHAYSVLPAIAICGGSIFMLWTWLSIAPAANASPSGPALIALGHVALAALAVRMRAVAPATFAVAVGALVLGLMMYMRARGYFAPGANDLYFWPMLAAAGIVVSTFGARPHRTGRVLIAAAGAIGASLLVILAAFSRPDFALIDVWAPLFAGAALLFGAALMCAREAPRPERDWPLDLWIYAAAALALIGLESLAPTIMRPAAHAGLALAFSGLVVWRGWRGADYAALAAAAFALTHAIAPDFVGPATSGQWPIWRALLFLAAAAVFLFGAGELASRRKSAKPVSEALNSACILAILLALFLGLRWVALNGIAIPLDAFSENALRALMLIAAGYIALPRGGEPGLIARVRGDVLMGAGLVLALLSSALTFNPWWGGGASTLLGPPLLNVQALAFAAPAALAFAAARRMYATRLLAARLYAGAGAFFAILWAIMEVRNAFHLGDMHRGSVSVLEADCYGLLVLLTALAIAILARLRRPGPFTQDLTHIMRGWGYAALGIAVFMLVVVANPWWGAQNPALSTDMVSGFAVLTLAAATGLSLGLGRALSRGVGVDNARFAAAASAALFALTFGHDAIRWLHQGGAMDDNASLFVDLEGFAHALWPLAFVLGASALTLRVPGRDTVRSYLYDLQAIWGAAIWTALIWAALGLWIVFNPWWGFAPVFAQTPIAALLGLTALLLAAGFSAIAPNVPHIRLQAQFARIATIAWVGHLFVALSLIVRRAFHGADMRAAIEGTSLETWSYSALWALFAAGVWGLGAMRKDVTLRWIGLGLLLFVTVKVGVFDTATLNGVIRAASVIGLAIVLILVALAARRFGGAQGSRE